MVPLGRARCSRPADVLLPGTALCGGKDIILAYFSGMVLVNFISQNVFLIVLAVVSGGMLLWQAVSRARGGASLGTLEATRLINQGAQVLDLRGDAEFRAGHLPGSRQVTADNLARVAEGIEAGKPILVVCTSGMRAGKAVATLKAGGRAEVFNLEGGIEGWKQAGLPLVTGR